MKSNYQKQIETAADFATLENLVVANIVSSAKKRGIEVTQIMDEVTLTIPKDLDIEPFLDEASLKVKHISDKVDALRKELSETKEKYNNGERHLEAKIGRLTHEIEFLRNLRLGYTYGTGPADFGRIRNFEPMKENGRKLANRIIQGSLGISDSFSQLQEKATAGENVYEELCNSVQVMCPQFTHNEEFIRLLVLALAYGAKEDTLVNEKVLPELFGEKDSYSLEEKSSAKKVLLHVKCHLQIMSVEEGSLEK